MLCSCAHDPSLNHFEEVRGCFCIVDHAAAERLRQGSQRCTPLGPHLRLCRLIAPRWRVYNADVQFTTHADKLSETKRAEKEIRDAHKKELQEKKLKTQEANPVLQCTSQHVVFHFHCTAG